MLLLVGCGGRPAGSDLESLPVWELASDLRIGAPDDPVYSFGSVGGLEVGPDGSIYSLHRQEGVVRRWGPDGVSKGTIGRVGEGPGEYTNPSALSLYGDSLAVLDGRSHRISFFTPEGRFLSGFTPHVDIGTAEQSRQGLLPPRPSALLGDGTLYGSTPGLSHLIVEGTLTKIAHVRMDRDGSILDTLAILPVGPESVLGVLRDGGGTFTRQPFGDATTALLTRDGSGLLVLERPSARQAGPTEFRLTRLDLGGDTVFSRPFSYEPTRIPSERVDSAVNALAESLHGFMGERTGTSVDQWRRWVREATYAPPFHTGVQQMIAGRDGTTWLALHSNDEPGTLWLVIDETGTPLGKVRTPEGARMLSADRSYVWGVEQDDLDVEYIVRYRLTSH